MREVEHVRERSRNCIVGTGADTSERPVVFDESRDRRLIGDSAIDKILLGERRNDYQRQSRAISAACLNACE